VSEIRRCGTAAPDPNFEIRVSSNTTGNLLKEATVERFKLRGCPDGVVIVLFRV
jgi:hypothetical protein